MFPTKQDIGKISKRIKSQISFYEKAVHKAHRSYLTPMVLSLLKDPSCFVSQVARHFQEAMPLMEKRILRAIHSPKMTLEQLMGAHLTRLRHYMATVSFDKLLIYADLSDLAKPHAKKMPDLDRVRDGSESRPGKVKTNPGFWLDEVYVQFPGRKTFPVVFYPFSTLEKGFRSITDLIVRHISLVFQTLGNNGLWISDRGYDALKFFCISSIIAGNS